MQMSNKFYMGIDVSKAWFDISLMVFSDHKKQPVQTARFDNTQEGIKALHRWLASNRVTFDDNSMVVIENTGVYHRLIWQYCSEHELPIHIGNAAHIKWSFGIARGKNDIVDSQRLCSYAFKHADELKATPVLNPIIIKLKDLFTARAKLITQKNSIKIHLAELKGSNKKEIQRIMEKSYNAALKGIEQSIEDVETQIKIAIKEDEVIKKNHDLLCSVPGIGHIIAVYIICCTANFAGNISGKQLACYAGVVPFDNSSGSSIKGRKKVHKMANKELKKLLHLSAITVVTHYPEFKEYYERKKAEGKHSLSVINAVKNKIVLRAVAVINKQEKYVSNSKNAA